MGKMALEGWTRNDESTSKNRAVLCDSSLYVGSPRRWIGFQKSQEVHTHPHWRLAWAFPGCWWLLCHSFTFSHLKYLCSRVMNANLNVYSLLSGDTVYFPRSFLPDHLFDNFLSWQNIQYLLLYFIFFLRQEEESEESAASPVTLLTTGHGGRALSLVVTVGARSSALVVLLLPTQKWHSKFSPLLPHQFSSHCFIIFKKATRFSNDTIN